jgi:hypothetical protein
MRASAAIAILFLASVSAYSQAAKSCDGLKAEIVKKLDANNVTSYSLEIVPSDKAKEAEGKVVGSCEGGTKKIVYRRTATPAQTPRLNRASPELSQLSLGLRRPRFVGVVYSTGILLYAAPAKGSWPVTLENRLTDN